MPLLLIRMALLWKLTGDDDYAEAAIKVMNAWAAGCKGIKSNDANQNACCRSTRRYTFANAGEIMRDYDQWTDTDFAKFKEWMLNVFASKNKDFMTRHQGTV